MAMELNESNFDKTVLNEKDVPVIVDFWAPWCGPCRSQTPILEQFAEKNSGKVKVYKVNVDENEALSARYGIMSIPTLLVFKSGQLAGKAVGLQNASALENLAGI